MRISDWSSDVCSSDLLRGFGRGGTVDGVVEQDVDPSKGGKSRINHVADLFFDADVDLECNRITSEPTDLLGHLRDCGLTASREEDMRSEEHTSELQSLMRISSAVFCLKKKNHTTN